MGKPRTFLLGVGCTKGGTTWLHRYLSAHPNVDFGLTKEYHVFDAIFLDECRGFVVRRTPVDIILGMLAPSGQRRRTAARYRFQNDPEAYFDYFDDLSRQSEDTFVVGDMTPSYCGLPVEAYCRIRDGLQSRGLAVRVIFLMRDPIERIWSGVRMRRRNRSRAQPDVKFATYISESEEFARQYTSNATQFRTRYENTIRNLESAFETNQLHFEFYEKLMTTSAIKGIMNFLDLPYVEPDFEIRHNATDRREHLDPSAVREARAFYASTYDFIASRFPDEDLKAIWPHY